MFRNRIYLSKGSANKGGIVQVYSPLVEWNVPIAVAAARGAHPHQTYFADRVFNGWQNPGWVNASPNDDYTPAVYELTAAAYPAKVTSASQPGNAGPFIPWNPSWVVPAGTDGQVIIIDPATGREWNMSQVVYTASTHSLSVYRANIIPVTEDGGGGPADYRTKANGFKPSRGPGIQYMAMLIRPQEIIQGKIYHALSMPVPHPGYDLYAAPAVKGEEYPGNEDNLGIPQGTRFYLNKTEAEIDTFIATWDAGVSAATKASMKIVFMAAIQYGIIISDNSGGQHIQFQHKDSYDWSPLGLVDYTAGGKTWPRDAFDGLITSSDQMVFVLPPDGVLYHDESGVVAPVAAQTPTITGTGVSGTDLTLVLPGVFLGEDVVTTTRNWQKASVDIGGATGSTYTVQAGDIGSNIRIRYTGANANGTTNVYSSTIAATSSWTQTDVFSGVTNGGWWKFKDWTTLKQTSGGSTNVTADNDPVQYAADQSGLGKNLTKPAYHGQLAADTASGGVDNGGGTDAGLATSYDLGINTTDNFTVCLKCIPCSNTASAVVATRVGTAGWYIRVRISGSDTIVSLQNLGTGGTTVSYTITGSVAKVQVTVIKAALAITIRVNGSQVATGSATGWTAGGATLNVGSRAESSVGNNHNAAILDVIAVDKVLSGADLSGTETRQMAL